MQFSQADLEQAPKIKLGGVDYAIPQLAIRQLRVIVPLFTYMVEKKSRDVEEANSETYISKLFDIIYVALTRAYPDLKKEDYLDWPVTQAEALTALQVILKQSGLVDAAEALEQGKVQASAA